MNEFNFEKHHRAIREAIASGEPIKLVDEDSSQDIGVMGYRKLIKDEVELANKAKALSNRTADFIDEIGRSGHCDKRWLAIAKTDLQKAYMSLIRSIERPNHF